MTQENIERLRRRAEEKLAIDPDATLTVGELAAYYRKDRQRVYRVCRAGKCRHLRDGRKVELRPSDWRAYEERMLRGPGADSEAA